MAFLRFAQEEVGLSDQSALAESLARLSENIGAVSLGSIHRIRSHIQDVALRMLASQKEPLSGHIRETIVETLATRVYAHGHAIGCKEAREMNLRAVVAPGDVETAMWNLLCKYEQDLKLREAPDIEAGIAKQGKTTEDIAIAVVESTETIFEFLGKFEINTVWQIPPGLQITTNLQIPPQWTPERHQDIVQEILQQIEPTVKQAVQQALIEQTPPAHIVLGFKSGKWTKISL